jgi:hypothetical protein
MKPGRKPRKEAVVKTTVYFLESDLNILDSKNRFKALKWAKEISLKAVSEQVSFMKYTENRANLENNS